MATYELRSEDGRSLRFDLDDGRRIVNMVVDELADGEEVRFFGEMPDHVDADDVPDHIRAYAASKGKRVCGYNPHCQTCFCDDDGNITCEPRC